jgi:hypothetical protein
MFFIFAAWLLVLLTFAIWTRALHSIPIYTSTELQLQDQTLQIQTVFTITQLLLALALACVWLHFVLENDGMHSQTEHLHNVSMHELDVQSLKRLWLNRRES